MDLDTVPSQQTWDEELKRGECHVVTFAESGLSFFRSYCDFAYNISWDEIDKYVDQVNKANETGTLHPKANITALPRHFFRESVVYILEGNACKNTKTCPRFARMHLVLIHISKKSKLCTFF